MTCSRERRETALHGMLCEGTAGTLGSVLQSRATADDVILAEARNVAIALID